MLPLTASVREVLSRIFGFRTDEEKWSNVEGFIFTSCFQGFQSKEEEMSGELYNVRMGDEKCSWKT